MTRWQNAPNLSTEALSSLDLDPLIARLLIQRGLSSAASARDFLDPGHVASISPLQFPDMEAAVARISSGIAAKESICIWGDFDVDGQTATTVLVQALSILGANIGYHIPIRGKEGHGVGLESLQAQIERGASLIVTCDTGITAHAAVDYAETRGVDFVITDHHEFSETLPRAVATLNPRTLPVDHPLANLAGVGVAYELASALLGVQGISSEFLLDLVALGLIADVAKLTGEARRLAKQGIEALRTTSRLGVRALAEFSGSVLQTVTEETVSFAFAPRLNALGRLSDANPAVEFLMTDDPLRARLLAAQIEGLNTQRRLLTDQVHQAAQSRLQSDPGLLLGPMLLLFHASWPAGVLGIVASKLAQRYGKPVILLSASDDGLLHGSARSIEGVDVTQAIGAHKHLLIGYGGHPMAAGLSLDARNLERFRKGIEYTVGEQLDQADIEEGVLVVDQWLALEGVSLELIRRISALAPFGPGNPQPVFAAPSLTLKSARELGRAKEHLKLILTDEGGATHDVFWWDGSGESLPEGKFDLAYSVREDSFGGKRGFRVELRDFRHLQAEVVEVASPLPEIHDLRAIPRSGNLPQGGLIWAEATDKTRGSDRYNLRECEDFVIWTAPPSRNELRMALRKVQPKRVYIVGVAPRTEGADEFLTRLTGMAKFVIKRKEGTASLAEFAATTGQLKLTIQLGLEWLAAGGHLQIERGEDAWHLTPGPGIADRYLQSELYSGVKSLLEETAAYRAYFNRADLRSVLQ